MQFEESKKPTQILRSSCHFFARIGIDREILTDFLDLMMRPRQIIKKRLIKETKIYRLQEKPNEYNMCALYIVSIQRRYRLI